MNPGAPARVQPISWYTVQPGPAEVPLHPIHSTRDVEGCCQYHPDPVAAWQSIVEDPIQETDIPRRPEQGRIRTYVSTHDDVTTS